MNEGKFSVLLYVNDMMENEGHDSYLQASNQSSKAGFEECVAWMRSELAAARGRTTEEQLGYTETLNRAVLGYETERRHILAMIEDLLAKKRMTDVTVTDHRYPTLAEAVFAEVIGLHVLELIMRNKEGLEEIQVVGKQIFEVRGGFIYPSAYQLPSIAELERIQQNLVLYNGDTLNPRKRWAEVNLRDGSRVTMTGFGFTAEPTLTIRFYTVKNYSLNVLSRSEYATISEDMREIVLSVLRSYFNMVVIGPTNSGKTNLIKAFIAEMPDEERIVTIESRLELMLKRDFPAKNIIEYEIDEDDELHSGNRAFKLALRQSPKRICHAEIRDVDANIYVRACTRGHQGSITSVHVNELEDVPEAITDMCMMDGRGMDPIRLTKRITEYVTQIGFEMALVDGKRKVVRIGEYQYVQGEVQVRDIVKYDPMIGTWVMGTFSEEAAKRIYRYDPAGYEALKGAGVVPSI